MKNKFLLLMLTVFLGMFLIITGTAAAQSVDVEDMSNEELMALLQTIMKKLESDSTADSKENGSESTDSSASGAPSVNSFANVSDRKDNKFSVYTNKKLVVGRMPDYYFIRKQPGGGGDDSGGDSDGGNMHTLEFHYGDYSFTIDIPEGSYGEYGIPTDVWKAW